MLKFINIMQTLWTVIIRKQGQWFTSTFQLLDLDLDIRVVFVPQYEGDDDNVTVTFGRYVSNEARQVIQHILYTASNSATVARAHGGI